MTDVTGTPSQGFGGTLSAGAHLKQLSDFVEILTTQQTEATQRILKALEKTRSSIVEDITTQVRYAEEMDSGTPRGRMTIRTTARKTAAPDKTKQQEHHCGVTTTRSLSYDLESSASALGHGRSSEASPSDSTRASCSTKKDSGPGPESTLSAPDFLRGKQDSNNVAQRHSALSTDVGENKQGANGLKDMAQRISQELAPFREHYVEEARLKQEEHSSEAKSRTYWNAFTIRRFDLCMAIIILLNFVMIFAQVEVERADIAAHLGVASGLDPHQRDLRMLVFETLELIFTAIFILELLVRIAIGRFAFFRSFFNVSDALIVFWTSLNLFVLQPLSYTGRVNLSYLRLFRACRVVWTLRGVRNAHIFENFRILTRTIMSSITALLWSMAGLSLVMVLASILISQSLNSFLLSPAEDQEDQKTIFALYGSSSRSLYTLFLVTFSDGWQAYVEPLKKDVGILYSFIFIAYIVSVRLSMLNVIVGLFVKDTFRMTEHDALMMLRTQTETKAQLISLCKAQDSVGTGCISLAQLQMFLIDPVAKRCISSLGLNSGEVEFLFSLMQDSKGQVNCRDLVDNMFRIKGHVRSLDAIAILKSTTQIDELSKKLLTVCQQCQRIGYRTLNQTKLLYRSQPSAPKGSPSACPKCNAQEKLGRKRRLLARLRIFMVILRQKTTKLGQTLMCHTYQDYLFYRGHLENEEYKIELRSDHEAWAEMFHRYKTALLALPSSKLWDDIHWIGSSAVPDLVAKPVLDMMITTSENNLEEVVHKICWEANDAVWQSEHAQGLQFPIGFYMEGWGFLQMPHFQASLHGLAECNIHIFHSGCKAAHEKIVLVDFLKSPEGKDYKDKYSILKLSLELRYKAGQLNSANYNKEKNFLVSQIIEAASAWDAARATEGAPWSAMEETSQAPMRVSVAPPPSCTPSAV